VRSGDVVAGNVEINPMPSPPSGSGDNLGTKGLREFYWFVGVAILAVAIGWVWSQHQRNVTLREIATQRGNDIKDLESQIQELTRRESVQASRAQGFKRESESAELRLSELKAEYAAFQKQVIEGKFNDEIEMGRLALSNQTLGKLVDDLKRTVNQLQTELETAIQRNTLLEGKIAALESRKPNLEPRKHDFVSSPITPSGAPEVQNFVDAQTKTQFQTALKAVGCYDGAIDGNWAGQSSEALSAWRDTTDRKTPISKLTPALLIEIQRQNSGCCDDDQKWVKGVGCKAIEKSARPKQRNEPSNLAALQRSKPRTTVVKEQSSPVDQNLPVCGSFIVGALAGRSCRTADGKIKEIYSVMGGRYNYR
jgi:hypothetical protein